MAGTIQNNLPIFDGKNYEDWVVKMDAILGFQEIDEIVKVFQKMSKAVTTKEIWEILQDGYGTAGNIKKIKLQSLWRQYELLSMGEQETIEGYISRIQVIVNAMCACDKIVKDKKIVHKILRTLTPQYNHIIVAIEESRDLEKMKVEELQNSLEAHEQQLMERKAAERDTVQNTNKALQVKIYKNRGNGRNRGRSRGGRGGRNGDRRNNDKCITAHVDFFENTTSVKNDKWPRNATQAEQVSLTGETNHAREDMSWYLDTGCSNHMTSNKRWVIDLDTSVKSVVRFADDSIIRAEGSDKVLIT
ncbi:uncharacterized protein LOC108327161 [Vigna angularis]|uniref:uncharacterized protein LOC108327161 n=1 Tax=Phaseolus angularis TaxID=3914 RepID=UPI00080A4857|nr:uncharacterized protein LOC108327161 [Vigna angularis]